MLICFQLMVLLGVVKSEIKMVYSYIYVFGQCCKIVCFNGWKVVVVGDMVGVVKFVLEIGDCLMVVLVLCLVVDFYGLEILEENVEDFDNNIICFVVFLLNEKYVVCESVDEMIIIIFVFNVCNILVVLYKVFGGFVINGINMMKFESYQIGGKFVVMQFFVDIEGYLDDENVKWVFDELKFFFEKVCIFGVYKVYLMCKQF